MDLIDVLIGIPEELYKPGVLDNWKKIEREKKYTLDNINNNKIIKASPATPSPVLHTSQFTEEDEKRMNEIVEQEETQYREQLNLKKKDNPDFGYNDLHNRTSSTMKLINNNTIAGQKYGEYK